MAHLHSDKQLRRQFLKAKRRIALGVAKDGDTETTTKLYVKQVKKHG